MRARTSASQACGSTSFILAVTIRLYMIAARSPPRSEPQNNHDFRPKAMPRTPRSAALFDRQMRPSSRKRVNALQTLEHVVHGLGDVVATREFGALLAHPGLQIGDQRCAELLSDRLAPFGALSIDRPLDLEQRIDPADHLQR